MEDTTQPVPVKETPIQNETVQGSIRNQKGTVIIILCIILIFLIVAGLYYFYSQQTKSISTTQSTPLVTIIRDTPIANKLELNLEEGQIIEVPGADIKIKAIWVSEICKNVPPPDCKDETILEFSHIELTRSLTLYIGGKPLEGQKASNVETFFGHRIELTSLKGKQIKLSIEIPDEIPGTMPGWLTYKNSTAGFELQHPKIFELIDRGESSSIGYNYRLTINSSRASGSLHIRIYNDVDLSLDEFTIQNINGYRGSNPISLDAKPTKFSLSNKEFREVAYKGVQESRYLFWLDSSRQKGVVFVIAPTKTEVQKDFYDIIQSFKFTQ